VIGLRLPGPLCGGGEDLLLAVFSLVAETLAPARDLLLGDAGVVLGLVFTQKIAFCVYWSLGSNAGIAAAGNALIPPPDELTLLLDLEIDSL
jgi:hypothetical protein